MITQGLFERGLNHVLRQSPGASEMLRAQAGRSVRFDLVLLQFDLRIADDGYFSEAAIEAPDATIRPRPGMITALPFVGRKALREADYSGDPALLQALDHVFKQLNWDVEADLAPLVGDIAARRLHAFGRDALAGFTQTVSALGRNAGEYVVEEAEWMARAVDIARFNHGVDQLADDVARFEARLRLQESRNA